MRLCWKQKYGSNRDFVCGQYTTSVAESVIGWFVFKMLLSNKHADSIIEQDMMQINQAILLES